MVFYTPSETTRVLVVPICCCVCCLWWDKEQQGTYKTMMSNNSVVYKKQHNTVCGIKQQQSVSLWKVHSLLILHFTECVLLKSSLITHDTFYGVCPLYQNQHWLSQPYWNLLFFLLFFPSRFVSLLLVFSFNCLGSLLFLTSGFVSLGKYAAVCFLLLCEHITFHLPYQREKNKPFSEV